MHILDIAPRLVWPPDNGSSARIYHLLRELSRNHQIRQFSQPRLSEVCDPSFATTAWPTRTYCEYRNPSLIPALASEWCHRSWIRPQAIFSGTCLRATKPAQLREWFHWADIAVVEFPWQFGYCRRAAPELPLVLASHNIEVITRTSNARAAGVPVSGSLLLRWVARLEANAVADADLILAVSDDDRQEYIRRFGADPLRVVTVPNGTEAAALFPLEPEAKRALRRELGLPERPTVVYLAAGPKIPDLEGLKWVLRVAAVRPDLTFMLVGGISARPYIEGNVIATGFVADHRPYLQAADISLNPIEFGGGTKIKVFDGLAAGLATVVFAETIRGTSLRDGEHVIVAGKRQAALERAVRELVDQPGYARRLAAAGRRFVLEHHDWKTIAGTLQSALDELLRGAPARTRLHDQPIRPGALAGDEVRA